MTRLSSPRREEAEPKEEQEQDEDEGGDKTINEGDPSDASASEDSSEDSEAEEEAAREKLQLQSLGGALSAVGTASVRERVFLRCQFHAKTDHFTETGSGQT